MSKVWTSVNGAGVVCVLSDKRELYPSRAKASVYGYSHKGIRRFGVGYGARFREHLGQRRYRFDKRVTGFDTVDDAKRFAEEELA